MKGPLDRTKIVLRHLPPSISQAMLTVQIDPKFSGRYNWLSFFPGNSSKKRVVHSRAFINFNKAEDVIEFAEFFNGHVFVNEKGTQYKAAVEYAPSQSIPKPWLKRDGREGTIFKDPEYVEFIEFIGKPVDHLPSAEIQLDRREAEKAAAGKDDLIITPLMQFIRQKRAANNGSRRSLNSGKSVKRIGRRSSDSSRSVSSKQTERIGVSTTVAKIPLSRSIKPNVQRETGGKIIKSILHPDRVKLSSQVEKDRQSQPSNIRILSKSNAVLSVEISGSDRKVADKSGRRTRNKDRPDRSVWTPLRKSNGLHVNEDLLSFASQLMHTPLPSSEGSLHLSRRRLPQEASMDSEAKHKLVIE